MSKINVDRMIAERSAEAKIYTPIVEAIVNSIDAIREKDPKGKGWIRVKFYRNQEGLALENIDTAVTPKVTSIEITDNGIGFNDCNLDSFDTLHGDHKISRGGKGFGRVFYRKFFNKVHIESIFEEGNNYILRKFDFTQNDLIENKHDSAIERSDFDEPTTTIFLQNVKPEHANKMELKLETIARKILEHLLVYFVDTEYECPKISLVDQHRPA